MICLHHEALLNLKLIISEWHVFIFASIAPQEVYKVQPQHFYDR
jgi:hypothetical protein